MDADDVSFPHRIARLLDAAAAEPDVSFWASAVRYFPRETLSNGMRRYESWINGVQTPDDILRDRFVECPLPHPAWMIRRDLFQSLGGYRADGPEDYDLFLRAIDAGARAAKVADTLLLWRDHPQRLSRTDPRYALEQFRACKARALLPLLNDAPIAIVGAGRDGKRWARLLRTRGHTVEAFYDTQARRIGQTIDGIPVRAASPAPGPGDDGPRRGGSRATRRRKALIAAGHRELATFFCVQ